MRVQSVLEFDSVCVCLCCRVRLDRVPTDKDCIERVLECWSHMVVRAVNVDAV